MNQKIPQMSGMDQVIIQPETQAETPIPANRAMADNEIIRLSKNQKKQMAHRGFIEIEQEWKTEPTWEEVTVGSSTFWKYVAPEARPTYPMADTDDGIVITDPGTFSKVSGFVYSSPDTEPFESFPYDGNASSSSANDGLVGPDVPAMAAEKEMVLIKDMPGRTDGDPQSEQNSLSLPGRDVVTADTVVASIAVMDDYAIATDATPLTIDELKKTGAYEVRTAKLAKYKTKIAGAGRITAISVLQQLIAEANAEP
jgi:hypothetical protein